MLHFGPLIYYENYLRGLICNIILSFVSGLNHSKKTLETFDHSVSGNEWHDGGK